MAITWQAWFDAVWAAARAEDTQPERVSVRFVGEPLTVTRAQFETIWVNCPGTVDMTPAQFEALRRLTEATGAYA